MAKKSGNKSSSLLNQIFSYLLPVVAVLFLVAIILAAIGGYMYETVWMVIAGVLVIALEALWYGWKNARLPGIGGKIAYIICAAVVLTGILFPALYWWA